jgi:hypothetical protein
MGRRGLQRPSEPSARWSGEVCFALVAPAAGDRAEAVIPGASLRPRGGSAREPVGAPGPHLAGRWGAGSRGRGQGAGGGGEGIAGAAAGPLGDPAQLWGPRGERRAGGGKTAEC